MIKLLKVSLLIGTTLFLIASFLLGLWPNAEVDYIVRLILAFYLLMIFSRTIFFFYGAFREKVHDYLLDQLPTDRFSKPFVSVLVPCYNEEVVIEVALNNLMNLDYPFYQIIVIDDGSTDRTYAIAKHVADQSARCSVQVIHQKNQGKAQALNTGLMHASGDLILCVDADSRIQNGSIQKAVRHFRDPKVGAVAGFIQIENQQNLLLQLQELEYLVGLNFTRRALSLFGVVPIVPGPAGMFRRQALFEAGGLRQDQKLFAEDAELSLRVITAGWKIKSEEDLVAITEAPASVMPLLRQRYRWNRGTFQALMLNIKPLLFGSGWRGRWVGGYLFTEAVITPIINFGLILYLFSYMVSTGEVKIFTTWYMYLLVVDALTTFLVTYRKKNLFKWMLVTMVNKVFFYYMLLTWRLLSMYEEWSDKDMTWDKLERTGNI